LEEVKAQKAKPTYRISEIAVRKKQETREENELITNHLNILL